MGNIVHEAQLEYSTNISIRSSRGSSLALNELAARSIATTFYETKIQLADRNYKDSAGEIGARGEVHGGGVVVEAGEARSKWDAGDVILDQAVDVDGGGGVAELDAGHQHENQSDDRVHRLQHLSLTLLPRCHGSSSSI